MANEVWTTEQLQEHFNKKSLKKPSERKAWDNISKQLDEKLGKAKRGKTKGRPKLDVKYVKFVFFNVKFNWNEAIKKAKISAYAYAKYKADEQRNIELQCEGLPVIDFQAKYKYTIYAKNRMKDPGNLNGANKPIEDALQVTGIIKNDGWKQIKSQEFLFQVDKQNPRVELEIIG